MDLCWDLFCRVVCISWLRKRYSEEIFFSFDRKIPRVEVIQCKNEFLLGGVECFWCLWYLSGFCWRYWRIWSSRIINWLCWFDWLALRLVLWWSFWRSLWFTCRIVALRWWIILFLTFRYFLTLGKRGCIGSKIQGGKQEDDDDAQNNNDAN